jgi:hypothetical protein
MRRGNIERGFYIAIAGIVFSADAQEKKCNCRMGSIAPRKFAGRSVLRPYNGRKQKRVAVSATRVLSFGF